MPPALAAATTHRPIRRALFVDRDGTLNPDLHYLKEADRLELFRGVGPTLRLAHDHGYLLVCVTNQSGIGRGLYSAEDVAAIHARLNERLRPHRAQIDAFYYCPHTPEEDCRCRKPKTGLFEDAQRDWNIDFGGSAIIGDRGIDVAAGRSLGLLTALVVAPGHRAEVAAELEELGVQPEIRADQFASAGARILARG
jgi:D-glycero-D-manno-heptose 1,7-bisphosphate phosphatase